jgi:NTP pyrophosphatase (non-canonical NTP hydrolase)
MNIDLLKYSEFVAAVTSDASNHSDKFTERVEQLTTDTDINVSLLLTAGVGLASETGEFNEIVKKILFQGKEASEDNIFHMKRELGDIFWYWINACRSLGLNPNDVINENVNKLKSRYPSGEFDPWYSENRKAGDL